MRFSKLYAAGKDFVCVDRLAAPLPHDPAALSRVVCDRHFGAGADGLLVLERSDRADIRLRLFHSDGRAADAGPVAFCCAARYVHGSMRAPQLRIESGADVAYLNVEASKGRTVRVRADLGTPVLKAELIPTTLHGNPPVEVPVTFPDTMHNVTCISLAGPYAVIFTRELTDALVHGIGPQMERYPAFPQRTSVAFVKVNRAEDVTVRLWERNAGEVTASASGA